MANKKPSAKITEDNIEDLGVETPNTTPVQPEDNDSEEIVETPTPKKKASKKRSIIEEVDIKEETASTVNVKTANNIEREGRTREQTVKQALEEEPKVARFIPLGIGEKRSEFSYVPVTKNGYRVEVPKGKNVMVPISIAKILDDSMTRTDVAGAEFKLDREDVKNGVSIDEALS